MKDVLEMLKALTYAEVMEIDKQMATVKKEAKNREKAVAVDTYSKTVDEVNALIEQGRLVKGSEVLVSYKGVEVLATVKTVPTVKAENLNLTSDSFATKDGSRYCEKRMFIRLA